MPEFKTASLLLSAAYVIAFCRPIAYAEEITAEQASFFESKIRPVLIQECYSCHSSKAGNVRGGLRLDTQALTHIGGASGPAVVPGNLEQSLLYNAINHQDFEMPPKRKLSPAVIDDFRKWIEMGAPDPRKTDIADIKSTITDEDIEQARTSFWAYQQPVKQPSPSAEDSDWPSGEIDRFILAKLQAAGMEPAADATATDVLRRLHFDLVGLPPQPTQIAAFTAEWKKSPQQAVAEEVERLLECKQFGERWGRHWLDVARYAESTGREVNVTYPHAWRYRDYVVASFNADKPFNEFVQEQIAGDLLPAKNDAEWAEHLIATTFLAIGPKNVNEQNRVQFAADLVDEQIDATTRVFLGMSVACARCHDHKFDAIGQADYYALTGIFGNAVTYFGNPPSEYGAFASLQQRQTSSLIRLPIEDASPFDKRYSPAELDKLKGDITDAMEELANLRGSRSPADDNANSQRERIVLTGRLADLSAKLAVVDERGQPLSYCMGVQDKGPPRNKPLLVQGEIDQAGPVVERGIPRVLCPTPLNIDPQNSGRLEFARWLGSDQNSLVARVMVNRVWQHLIGQGIVNSTENFGVTGQQPSHPELLDYLAVRLVEQGWSVKSLVREIANSRAYRMASAFDPVKHEKDPDNALVWRANPRRLDAEALRDAMLSISGEIELDPPRGSLVAEAGYTRVRNGILGDPREILKTALQSKPEPEFMRGRMRPGVGSSQDSPSRDLELLRGRMSPGSGARLGQRRPLIAGASRESMMAETTRNLTNQLDMEQAKFRSVYLPIVRDEVPRALEVFDFANADTITGVRETSNTPNQALYMLNNRFVIQQSDAFARRVMAEHSQPAERVEHAFELAYGRQPTAGERSATIAFARSFLSTGVRSQESAAETWSAICQSLFAAAEFRFIE